MIGEIENFFFQAKDFFNKERTNGEKNMEFIRRVFLMFFAPKPVSKKRQFQYDEDEDDIRSHGRPDAYAELGEETPYMFSDDD